MRRQKPDKFIVVSVRNMREIAKELEAGKGIIIVAEPKYWGSPAHLLDGNFEVCLFNRPTIDLGSKFLRAPRGTKKVGGKYHQTGWGNDREYRLRPKPQSSGDSDWDSARNLFENLLVGKKYEFQIAFAHAAGADLGYKRHLALYVPRSISPRAGLTYAFTWMTEICNAQAEKEKTGPYSFVYTDFRFTQKHIKQIAAYALKDLKTGDVLRHNVQAGQDADMMVGLA